MNNLEQLTALFRGFRRLQNFALDPSCHHKDITSLNKYLNPESGKSTAYAGQIISIYDDQNGNNGVYFVTKDENGFALSEKFATVGQITDLTTQVETAIKNMVTANPHIDLENLPEGYNPNALEEVKIADKTYKLVKAVDGEVSDAKNLYAIEIAGVTYNLKTNLDNYVTKDFLEGIVGSLNGSLDERISDVEKILGKLIDIDNDGKIDEIKDILAKLETIDPEKLDILDRIDSISSALELLDVTVSDNKKSIAEQAVLIGKLSQDIIRVDEEIRADLQSVTNSIDATREILQGNINQVNEKIDIIDAKVDDHINNLYGVKRVKNLVFSGESRDMEYWVTADNEKWLSVGDVIEQVSVSIMEVPENFNDSDYKFRFVVNGEHIITEDDIMFDEQDSTFEFSFNKRLKADINSAAFSVNMPAGAVVNVIITYVIMEKIVFLD